MRRIGLLRMDSLKFLGLSSLLRASYSTSPTLRHHTSRVIDMLLEPELDFDLVERLSDNFGHAYGIVHAPFGVEIVLSL